MDDVTWYEHHRRVVAVKTKNKGKHRDSCLCYQCYNFRPETREANCRIANAVFSLCVLADLVLPVWECPEFTPAEEE